MILRMLKNFFAGVRSSPGEHQMLIAQRIDRLPGGELPADQRLLVFDKERLVAVYDDQPEQPRRRNEIWWKVPAADTPIRVLYQPEPTDESQPPATYETELKLRFESDGELLRLIEGRDFVTLADLIALATSTLAGILDSRTDSLDPTRCSPAECEQLRARLSLALQNHGLRCTQLTPFECVRQQTEDHTQDSDQASVEVPANAESDEKVPSTGVPESDSVPDTAAQPSRDLLEAVQRIRSVDDWEQLVAAVDEQVGGLAMETIEELEDLGQAVMADKSACAATTARLRELANAAADRAGIADLQHMRMRGLDLRLQSFEAPDSHSDSDRDSNSPAANGPEIRSKRRPWTWWLLSRISADRRLVNYLRRTTSEMKSSFERFRLDSKISGSRVALRRIDERLELLEQMLESVPTLRPGGSLRLSRTQIARVLTHVERAATLMETALSQSRELNHSSSETDQWKSDVANVSSTLDALIATLRDRRQVRET